MKKSMDAIAERILEGIANQGVCLLYEDELKPIWNGQADQPAMERGMLIRNFAHAYGFEVQLSDSARTAVFRKSD